MLRVGAFWPLAQLVRVKARTEAAAIEVRTLREISVDMRGMLLIEPGYPQSGLEPAPKSLVSLLSTERPVNVI
jgi:hypothetical protein